MEAMIDNREPNTTPLAKSMIAWRRTYPLRLLQYLALPAFDAPADLVPGHGFLGVCIKLGISTSQFGLLLVAEPAARPIFPQTLPDL